MARLLLPCAAFVLALIATLLCRAATGVSLGLFIGGVGFATLIVPPLAAGESAASRRILASLSAAVGVALGWLTALGEPLTLAQWLACAAALLTYALALAGICSLLRSIRCNPALAAGVVTTLGALWLTWPVWLSRALLTPAGDTLVAWLVPAHPLFGINGVLDHLGTWDRQPLAYDTLTVLDQHVFYELPPNVLMAALVHGLIAAATFALAVFIEHRRGHPAPVPAPAAVPPTDVP